MATVDKRITTTCKKSTKMWQNTKMWRTIMNISKYHKKTRRTTWQQRKTVLSACFVFQNWDGARGRSCSLLLSNFIKVQIMKIKYQSGISKIRSQKSKLIILNS